MDGHQIFTRLEFIDYIGNTIPILLVEFLAAIVGIYYLKKETRLKSSVHLVTFLWLTLFVEVIGSYAPIAYFSDYKYFSFVEGTPFSKNYWLYNCFLIVSFSFFVYYFRSFIKSKKTRLLLKVLIFFFIFSSIINLLFSEVFFVGYSQYVTLTGTLLLFFSVVLFYFELLRSDFLLQLKQFLPIYISVGVLLYNLCVTPIDIFSNYFSAGNDYFVKLKNDVYLYANIFMYVTFIVGFIVCSRRKKSY